MKETHSERRHDLTHGYTCSSRVALCNMINKFRYRRPSGQAQPPGCEKSGKTLASGRLEESKVKSEDRLGSLDRKKLPKNFDDPKIKCASLDRKTLSAFQDRKGLSGSCGRRLEDQEKKKIRVSSTIA